ncbi:MAG TPA: phage tail protein [Pyrinomonadaceae bacterium]|nr:phage tail protein [Pyrinomonadaceae bacterium]
MPPVFRADPYGGYNFEVVIKGISDDGTAVKGSFSEVSGLDVELSPIEYRTGSEDITVRKLPGLAKYTNIVLKWGVTGDLAFWNWILEGISGKVHRTEGSIILLDEQKQEVLRWNFKRGWPCKMTGPGLNAKNNEVAMDSLEICHEGLSVDGQAG